MRGKEREKLEAMGSPVDLAIPTWPDGLNPKLTHISTRARSEYDMGGVWVYSKKYRSGMSLGPQPELCELDNTFNIIFLYN